MEAKNLDDFIFIYKRFATTENKSPRTIETVAAAIRKFDDFLGGCSDVRLVQAEDLRNYIASIQQKSKWCDHPTIKDNHGNLSPHSIASYVRSIRSFWSWLKREEFIENNPFEKVKVPKAPRRKVNILSPEQITKLLKVIPTKKHTGYRDYAIVVTLYGTGLRITELLSLKMDDVDFDTGQLTVMGKGSKQRFVYMSPTVFKVLTKYLHQWRPKIPSQYFFIHSNGRPLTRFYMSHRLQAYGSKAKITGVRCSPHTLRSSFAVNYLRNGGDTFTLQRILGHSSLEMTRHYSEVSDNDVEIKQKAFSPAERLGIKV